MNVTYDPRTDTLSIVLTPADVAESNEDKPGVTLDYDVEGNLIGLKILDASKKVPDVTNVNLKIAV